MEAQDVNEYHGENHGTSNYAKAVVHDRTRFLTGALLALSIAANVMLCWQYGKTENEVRMQEYYLLELDAKFIKAGLKEPNESIAKKLQEK